MGPIRFSLNFYQISPLGRLPLPLFLLSPLPFLSIFRRSPLIWDDFIDFSIWRVLHSVKKNNNKTTHSDKKKLPFFGSFRQNYNNLFCFVIIYCYNISSSRGGGNKSSWGFDYDWNIKLNRVKIERRRVWIGASVADWSSWANQHPAATNCKSWLVMPLKLDWIWLDSIEMSFRFQVAPPNLHTDLHNLCWWAEWRGKKDEVKHLEIFDWNLNLKFAFYYY